MCIRDSYREPGGGDSRAPEHLSADAELLRPAPGEDDEPHGHGDDKDYHHGDEAVHECVVGIKQAEHAPLCLNKA